MTLYKYVVPERTDVLEQGLIRHTQVNALNDPFDSLPAFADPPQDALDKLPLKIREMINLDDGTLAKVLDYQLHHFDEVMSAMCVFLSLCEDPLNTTMWSHYADSHKGFVIGFDETHPYFAPRNDFEQGLRKVAYSNERYRLNVMQAAQSGGDPDFNEEFAKNVILTKSEAWAYEKEWRLVRYPKDATMIYGRYSPHPIYLYRIPLETITEIYLGCRMSLEKKHEIRDLLSYRMDGRSDYVGEDDEKLVLVHQVRMTSTSYGLTSLDHYEDWRHQRWAAEIEIEMIKHEMEEIRKQQTAAGYSFDEEYWAENRGLNAAINRYRAMKRHEP